MRSSPSLPSIADAPAGLLERGHLWVQELVDGFPLRFSIDDTGQLQFGTGPTDFDGTIPYPYRHAVRHVRETIDWSVLTADLELVQEMVFFGVATTHQTLAYEWERTPSVLGHDIWVESRQEFLPTDTVEKVFNRLALDTVPIFEKEQPATHFYPDRYEMPSSRWYDGPPKGVVLRNKRGQRAAMVSESFRTGAAVEHSNGKVDDLAALAVRLTPERRLERVRTTLPEDDSDVETIQQRVIELVFRESYPTIVASGHARDMDRLADEIATRTRQYLYEEQK